MQPIFKKPSKGNPHELTVKQHVHSAHLIRKFNGSDGKVQLFMLEEGPGLPRRAKSTDAAFCTMRRWDQKTETNYFFPIEDQYFKELALIIGGASFSSRNHKVITEYYCLWNVRKQIAKQPRIDLPLKNVLSLAHYPSEADREKMEKFGIITFSKDHKLESHFLAGPMIIQNVDKEAAKMQDVKWAVVKAEKGQFICADAYPNTVLMPVTPTLALIQGTVDGSLGILDVAEINRVSMNEAEKFYFCQDRSLCPFLKIPRDWPYECRAHLSFI